MNIMTNVGSQTAQTNMLKISRNLNQSIARLSSGSRLTSAADDAAGVAISTDLRAQLRGYNQAIRNANDGVAILQTAEGSYNAQAETLTRMRELAVQSSNDSMTDAERAYIHEEFSSHMAEIDRVASVTEFNGLKLLTGSGADGSGNFEFQVGMRNSTDDRITINMVALSTGASGLNVSAASVSTQSAAQASIDQLDDALDGLAVQRSTLGATINQLNSSIDNLSNTVTNVTQGNAQIQDVNVASESASFAKSQVLQQAGVAMLAQANQAPSLALRLLG